MYSINNSSTVYVSQKNGNDKLFSGLAPTPDGLGNGPFKTLRRALNMIRNLRASHGKRPLSIAFTDDYFLEIPIELTSPISDVTLESFGTMKKIIGGISIDGWKRDSFNGVECFSAKLPDKPNGEKWDFTDMFINGKRAQTTRFPKQGTLKIKSTDSVTHNLPNLDHFGFPAISFEVFPEDLEPVEKIEDAIINYYHYWIDEHSPIESYDRQRGTLKMKYLSRFSASGLYEENHPSSVFYYLTNVPNTFGEKNEWYLDRASGIVYYVPEDISSDPSTVTAYVPTLDHLVDISGTDIRLRNLELTCTSGDYASIHSRNSKGSYEISDPPVSYGGDIQSVCWAHGAIRIKDSARCSISDCHIHGVGIHAIEIGTGCSDIRIESNSINDVCAGGVKVFGGAYGADEKDMTRNCRISGNHISHCGIRYDAGCGIFVAHASDNEISDNEIHDTGYTGISVGWVWGYAPSSTYGNIIRANHLYNIGRGDLSDLGAIYLLGKQHGTYVSENRIHDVKSKIYGGWGIYLDEGSSYVTVEKNVVYNTQDETFHLHYGSHNIVRNNIFYSTNSPCIRTSTSGLHSEIVCEQNIFITNGTPIYHRSTNVNRQGFSRNILWDISKSEPVIFTDRVGRSFSLDEFVFYFHQDCGSIATDPMIAGLSEFDFTLSESSPAFSLGFAPIPRKTLKNS
ncbi:MAG: right-handed parallel beta-helix repeat-containing protein [Ruminococcaceae bacterium]|nr:right-handed parallel beta-helix repeat-containing protein [Oscillospiraceae bacterium]